MQRMLFTVVMVMIVGDLLMMFQVVLLATGLE